jgi:hypothetical protein
MTSGGTNYYGDSYESPEATEGILSSCGCRPPDSIDVDECEGVTFHQCLFTQITISVGITMPNHIGLYVNYKICFGNTTCKKGVISVFGNPGTRKDSQISSEHFFIREDTVREHP